MKNSKRNLDDLPSMGNITYYRKRLQQAHELIELLLNRIDPVTYQYFLDGHTRKMIDEWFKNRDVRY